MWENALGAELATADNQVDQSTLLTDIKTAVQSLDTSAVAGTIELGAASLAALETVNASIASLPLPSGASTEATLSAVNAKITEVDTSNISGTVELGATSLAALESVNASIASLPLPAGAATETTLSSLNAKVTEVDTGNISGVVELGATSLAALETVNASIASLPLPSGASTEATLALIKSATDSLLTASNAIKSAVESLNTKTTVANTGNISGTVALDAPTLAALENTSVAVSNFPATQAVSASSLPLPTGAATESTLSAVNAKLPALDSGRVPVSLPPGSSGLTDTELRASPLDVSASSLPLPSGAATDATLIAIQETTQSVRELSDTILALLSAVLEKMPRVTGNDQAAVSVEGNVVIGSGTVNTVLTVTSMTQLVSLLQLGGQEALTVARNQMIPMHIYNNIIVS